MVASGLKPAETKGRCQIRDYILGPEVQIQMTVAGGFLPMTPVARAAAGSKLLKGDLAALRVSMVSCVARSMTSPCVYHSLNVRVIVRLSGVGQSQTGQGSA